MRVQQVDLVGLRLNDVLQSPCQRVCRLFARVDGDEHLANLLGRRLGSPFCHGSHFWKETVLERRRDGRENGGEMEENGVIKAKLRRKAQLTRERGLSSCVGTFVCQLAGLACSTRLVCVLLGIRVRCEGVCGGELLDRGACWEVQRLWGGSAPV